MSLVIHSLWAAVAVYFVHTAAGVVREFKAAPVAPVLPPPVEIPEDLVAVANQEREPWAQEEVLLVWVALNETFVFFLGMLLTCWQDLLEI